MPLYLKDLYRQALEELLALHLPTIEVWAHGSRVIGTAHEGSDLDIVLRNPSDLSAPCSQRQAFIEAYEASTIPRVLDVADWSELPNWLQEKILKNHEIIKKP